MLRVRAPWCAAILAASSGLARADVITDWKNEYLNTVRTVGGGPMPISRAAAMYSVAMYDAVNAVDLANSGGVGFQPFCYNAPAIAGSSREAAAAVAAHTVMSALYGVSSPGLQASYDARLAANLAAIPNSPAKTNGINLGLAVASAMDTLRFNDGSGNNTPYVPGTNPGDWRPSIDTPNIPGIGHAPNWGLVTPWVLNTPNQFVPNISGPGHPLSFPNMATLLASPEYAAQVNEVKSLGDRFSGTRTADQTQLAWFWANDRDGTYKPPGHMLSLTDEVASQQGVTDLSSRARMFAMVGASLGDAGIAAWWTKYQTNIDLWRPTDAIRETQDDGNAGTTPDPSWLPLLDFTPPFPAWISGHSTFGGAWAAAMAAYFGTDNIAFTGSTDEFAVNPGLGYPANLTRSWSSFSEAGFEDAISRVYLGVHYRWDCEDGYTMGQLVADWVTSNAFQPVPAPSGALALSFGATLFGLRRRR